MQVKEGFMLREIVGEWVVVPIGNRLVEFNGIMSLNDSGRFLWELLQTEKSIDELVDAMLKEYAIDRVTAKADIEEFISVAGERGVFEG